MPSTTLAAEAKVKPQQQKQQQTGTIIVYRRYAYVGSARSFPFTFNGGPVIKLRLAKYIRFVVPPGI
jgi:hypothetical protein